MMKNNFNPFEKFSVIAHVGISILNPQDSVVIGGKPRSPHWPLIERKHLVKQPLCQACGNTVNLNVHHILPFHLFPEMELVDDNLITLCINGVGGTNCHLVIGHFGNWSKYNPNVKEDAIRHFKMLHQVLK